MSEIGGILNQQKLLLQACLFHWLKHLAMKNAILFCLSLLTPGFLICQSPAGMAPFQAMQGDNAPVVINELDCDTEGTDILEFIELIGEPGTPLDGLVVVLFNGASPSNASYAAYDLDGYALNENGFFVIGNAAVPNVGLVIPTNSLQNGADGIGIYAGNATDWPSGSVPVLTGLIDALVYGTSDPDDTDLLAVLTPGQPQANEQPATANPQISMSRIPDGGAPFLSSSYVEQAPTPGAPNGIGPDCAGGTIAPGPNQLSELCVGEPADPLLFTPSGHIGSGYFIVATDAAGIIVAVASNGAIDFTGLPAGAYTVTGVAYTGESAPSTGILLSEVTSTACLSLSTNTVSIILSDCSGLDCAGGQISANGGSVYFSLCADSEADLLSLSASGAVGDSYTYIVTNEDNTIVLLSSSTVDGNTLGAGTYRIWGVAYSGTLDPSTTATGQPAAGILASDGCTDLSSGFVQVIVQNCTLGEACTELFISEYLEGTGNNKALEVYNPTASPVDLTGYGLYTFNNGAVDFSSAFGLAGILMPGDVFVVANSGAASEILAVADATSNVANFNGNDAIQLRFNDFVLDQIGVVGENPSSAWTFGSDGSTLDRALVRKSSVNAPTDNWLLSTGQWDIFPATSLTQIGQHAMVPCAGNEVVGFTTTALLVEESAGTILVDVEAFNFTEPTEVIVTAATGTADAADYSDAFPLTLDFAAGNSTQTIEVTITDDLLEESAEFFSLTLSSASNLAFSIGTMIISIAPSDPVYEVYSIGDIKGANDEGALDSLGIFCELRGVVHTTNFNSAGLHFHMFDSTGAIKVFSALDNLGYAVSVGDSVHVRGMIEQFMGQAEIIPQEIDVIANELPILPASTTGILDESLESFPVRLECVGLAEGTIWTNQGSGFFVDVTDGLTVFTVRIDADAGLFGTTPPQGQFTIQGVVEQEDPEAPYDSGYRLWPSFTNDLFDQVVASFTEFDQLQYGDNGATVELENTSTGASIYNWDFGDGSGSSEANPTHDYAFDFLVNTPDFAITLIATNTLGCADTLAVSVSSFYVGLDESQLSTFLAYPNPARNYLVVEAPSPMRHWTLTDATGRIIGSSPVRQSGPVQIDLSHTTAGIYLLTVDMQNGVRASTRILVN